MNKHVIAGHGHGVAGRYGGLPDPYGLEEQAKIVLISVPFDQTSTYQKGSDLGPDAIIEASRHMELYDIETDSEVFLHGIFTAPPIKASSSSQMIEKTYQLVKKYLKQEKYVVTMGGEHTISYGAIRAFAEHYHTLTVVQFDAHLDLYDAYEANPFSHASVMSRVKELPQIQKIVAVGIRSAGIEELKDLNRKDTFFAHDLCEQPDWIDQVLEKLSGPIYITFDLDAFDCSLMSSTGTPEPGGLQWNQALKILKRIAQEKSLVGFDIVELMPRKCNAACDYLAAKLIYKILSYKYI